MSRPFRAILILVTLMVIGVTMIPLLSVQYMPATEHRSMTINYWWPKSSAKVVEAQVTSAIEGAVAPISGIAEISSYSTQNRGAVSVSLKEGVNLDAIRFEISSRIRNIYPKLPKGVSYPYLSAGIRGNTQLPILAYTLNADLPTAEIEKYAQTILVDNISTIEGVESVNISGATPYHWEVIFDAESCDRLGISTDDIRGALSLGGAKPLSMVRLDAQGSPISINLTSNSGEPEQWGNLLIKNINGHIIHLSDIATIEHKEEQPNSYSRINGLNTVNLTIFAVAGVNNLTLAAKVKERVSELENLLPQGYSVTMVDDATIYVKKELDKIYYRTALSVFILLLFVFLVSRSLRYLAMIVVTLTANILIAFIFYVALGVEIHLYSLAGITVSLGMVIDTSIIMLDHYSRFGNRKVFVAILAALLTTIGALAIVYFLPYDQRQNLVDFSIVIIINLTVSLFISALFIPALIDRFPLKIGARKRLRTRGKRRVIIFGRIYMKFIRFGRRWRWAFIVVAILGFGLPVHMLPSVAGYDKKQNQKTPDSLLTFWQLTYNNTIGSRLYQQTLKEYIEPALGGSLRLFAKNIYSSYVTSTPERTKIYINASMPAGCTVHQLNEVMRQMENFLAQFDEIDIFRTYISSHERGQIVVTFKDEFDRSTAPSQIKELATVKGISLGGVAWSIYGVGEAFNNSLALSGRSNNIELMGYNYDRLYSLAQQLMDSLQRSSRVTRPVIAASRWETDPVNEFFVDFNFVNFALYGINATEYYNSIESRLYSSDAGRYYNGKDNENVVLKASTSQRFDAWHLENDMLPMGKQQIKLSDLGSIRKQQSGNNIYKTDQQYTIAVAFDFIGSSELAERFTKRHSDRLKEELPVGYSVTKTKYFWWGDDDELPYSLLGLVVVIIFFTCSVLFESIRQPLVIISLIPISFIGVFLTFYIFRLSFDQGGFASFVLLCGIVVNAGIYLINQYNVMWQSGIKAGLTTYLRCFNRKIIPITLTIISTVLGLLPFVVISREPFWFSFAVGAMGGMIFSLVAIFIFLPIFTPIYKR